MMERRAFLGSLVAFAFAPYKVLAGGSPVMGVDMAAPNTVSFTVRGLMKGDRITVFDPNTDEVLYSEVADPCSTSHNVTYSPSKIVDVSDLPVRSFDSLTDAERGEILKNGWNT